MSRGGITSQAFSPPPRPRLSARVRSASKALWPVFHQGVKHHKGTSRVGPSGGSSGSPEGGRRPERAPHHEEIYRRLAPCFPRAGQGNQPPKKAGRPKPESHELAEMWRCAAALERLTPEIKESLGDAILKEGAHGTSGAHVLWCLGRLGARVPLYGPANTVVRKEAAEQVGRKQLAGPLPAGRESGRRDLAARPNWRGLPAIARATSTIPCANR